VVADFGIAKALASATQGVSGARTGSEAVTGTAAGMAVGTPAYMAPEQIAADPTMDHRVDLYALGLIAYEALAGAHPYAGRAPQAMLAAQLTELPAPLLERRPEMRPALAALVAQLLAKDPAARHQSAAAVVQALDDVSAPARLPAPRGRRTAAGVAAALVLALGIGGYAALRSAAPASGKTAARAALRAVAVLPFVNTRRPAGRVLQRRPDRRAGARPRARAGAAARRARRPTRSRKSVAAAEIGKR
jgi:serine/threonine-protein kinase